MANTSLPFINLVTNLNFCAFNFLYPNRSAVLTVLRASCAYSCSIFITQSVTLKFLWLNNNQSDWSAIFLQSLRLVNMHVPRPFASYREGLACQTKHKQFSGMNLISQFQCQNFNNICNSTFQSARCFNTFLSRLGLSTFCRQNFEQNR